MKNFISFSTKNFLAKPIFFKQIQLVSSKSNQKTFKNELFIEKSRFKPSEPGLSIYQSKEKPIFCMFTLGFLGLFGFFSYKAYLESQHIQEGKSNLYMSVFLMGAFVLLQWKIHKTVKSVYIDVNGKAGLLEIYRFGGFFTEGVRVENKLFNGFGTFYPRIFRTNRIPIFNYRTEKKKRVFFL